MTSAVRPLTLIATLGATTMGGVYFAFSTFVMQGLRKLPADDGIAAMNAINRAASTSLFMTALFGTAAVSVMETPAEAGTLGETHPRRSNPATPRAQARLRRS